VGKPSKWSVKLPRNRLRGDQSQLNDHTDCGVGGSQYGPSEDIERSKAKQYFACPTCPPSTI
ncbi:MAG TPA: hypothetical protein VF772_05690, partial [Terriglobales bacterium]